MALDEQEFEEILDWLSWHQKTKGDTFKVIDFRVTFSSTTSRVSSRLQRLQQLGIVLNLSTPGWWKIVIDLNPEKIKEIKKKHSPKYSIFKRYEFKGEMLTIKEIFEREKPPMTLGRFLGRLKGGWSILEALKIQNSRNQQP